jgi:hypothetical protein
MSSITLTGPDLADLAAGLRFNTLNSNGDEVVIDGAEFATADVSALAEGGRVIHEIDGTDYVITAPDEVWAGHREPEEMNDLQKAREEQ